MKFGISKVFYSSVVAVIYLLAGIFLLIKYIYWQEVRNVSYLIFGLAIIAYGIFRGYRAYLDYKIAKEEEDELE